MLTITFDDDSLELPADGKILIGSDEDTDVCIESPKVSPRHAEISASLNGECWIRDLGSDQGTYVNGRRVKFQKLEAGDELRFGPKNVRFACVQSLPDTQSQDASLFAISPGAGPREKSEPGPARSEPRIKPEADVPRPEEKPAPAIRALAPAVRPVASPAPVANERRATHLMRLFILLVLTNASLFVACAIWFYTRTKSDLEERLQSFAATLPAAPRTGPSGPTPNASPAADTKTATDSGDLKKQVGALRSSMDDLQKKLAASEKRSGDTAQEVAGLSAFVDEQKKASAAKDAAPGSPAASEASPTISQDELVLLKERNRLTAYADEAIATGARGPYERLWDSMDDPNLANLVHAARAEILRVQDCYINGQRVKFYGIQQHQIPVAEIFPESAALTPAQLSDDQLIQVLQDQKQSWQTRVKAAWHLGQRRSTKVGDALLKAIKSDPMLDVAAEATFSFEQITGYHAKLFEVPPLEAWWKSYNEKAPSPKPAPKAAQSDGAGVKTKPE